MLATTLAGGCSDVETIENKNEDGVLLEKYSRKKDSFAKHGSYFSYYPSGQVHEQRNYNNDVLNGESKVYYQNGKIDYVETHLNGVYEGLYQKYYPTGQLSNEGQYVNDEMTGIWKRWYEDGVLREEVTFAANNENGPFKEFYPSGKIKTEGQYLEGDNEQGELLIYDEQGELAEKMICDYGVCMTNWRKEGGDIEVDLDRLKRLAELKKTSQY